MKVKVANFGAIAHAEVDLNRNLIIFTGENNTGKTYLAYLIYNILNPFFSKGDKNNLESKFVYKKDKASDKFDLLRLFEEFIAFEVKEKLDSRFVAEKEFFKNFDLQIEIPDDSFFYEKIYASKLEVTEYDNDTNTNKLLFEKKKGDLNIFVENPEEIDFSQINLMNLKLLINPHILNKSFLIPAERQGINLFHKELSLIKNKAFDELLVNGTNDDLLRFLRTRFNRYSKPIKDALDTTQNLDVIQKQKSEFAYLGEALEKTFLKGEIFITDEGDIKYKPKNVFKALDIHMTSSTVKSLATLSIYLSHIAQKGDFIIIDEPELNLHADNQRKIAQFIARLINEGFRVLISTHSEYILREINNLIALKTGFGKNEEKGKKLMQEYGYQENQLLSPEQVGVYLFKQGSPVKEVAMDEQGFSVETIDAVTEKMIEIGDNILFTLHDY